MSHYNLNGVSYSYPVYLEMERVEINAKKIADCILKIYLEGSVQLVCRGSSGIIIATAVYNEIKKINQDFVVSIRYVRKKTENSHSSDGLYLSSSDNIVIVDDFICSGETMTARFEELEKARKSEEYLNLKIAVCCRNPKDIKTVSGFKRYFLESIKILHYIEL